MNAQARELRIGAIVQARMTSSRLPGKVLAPIAGQPLLRHLLDRLHRCASLDQIVVATSSDWTDAPVERFCAAIGVACVRGSLDDVAGRFAAAARAHRLDAFVRICGDSLLIDPTLVDQLVERFRAWRGAVEVVTNVLPRSFPTGQSVEVIESSAFLRACREMSEQRDREHVTTSLYASAERYRITNVRAERDVSGVRLVVDTPEDLERMRRLFTAMDRPQWQYTLDEILSLRARLGTSAARRAPAA